jgi:hypothetical protein
MRIFFFLTLFITVLSSVLSAQQCASFEYRERELEASPALKIKTEQLEEFIRQQSSVVTRRRGGGEDIIIIPVVVHNLFHNTSEIVSDQQVYSQIDVLNKCFRRQNADTVNTPSYFKSVAADCEIEFKLATTDPFKKGTTGIIRKYTPVERWSANDDMKFTAKGGDDAWDTKSYLNIWVCNLNRTLGYASFPGGPDDKDGVVINLSAFGYANNNQMGKTAVHEIGHWLGLRHTWGDAYCGDDWVDDTPKQANFTSGCPSGIRVSCSNDPYGDMYMNYMDLTSDECTNLFTEGQKARMRAQFSLGGPRMGLLTSIGLLPPRFSEIPAEPEMPKWMYANVYPNPATSEIKIDLTYDIRWVGKTITIVNNQGQVVTKALIDGTLTTINISKLPPGIYFLSAKKEDGATIKQKLVKL